MDQVTSRVCLGDGGVLRWNRVMAGEYRCDTDHGTYYAWAAYKIVIRGAWCREEDCWRLDYGHEKLGDYRTLTDAKIAANRHHQEKTQ